jgi:hypothetical protein
MEVLGNAFLYGVFADWIQSKAMARPLRFVYAGATIM